MANNAEQAQEARAMFELFEDSSPLSENEARQLLGDFSSLSELFTVLCFIYKIYVCAFR